MLTYRTGVSGHSGARAMVAHLVQATLPPAALRAARYYADPGVQPTADDADRTVPQVRSDLDQRLGVLLGIDPRRILDSVALAHLLSGRRADGAPIPGRRVPTASPSLAEALHLATDRLPTVAEIERVLSGHRADTGDSVATSHGASIRRRLLQILGAEVATPVSEVLAALAHGRRVDGTSLQTTAVLDALTSSREGVAWTDLCWSAPKDVSLVWAFSPPAERALVEAAHRDAVRAAMAAAEAVIGRTRRGKGGRGGSQAGTMAWIEFPHYTARPTVEIASRDSDTGEAYTAFATVRTAGTPQLHTHVCLLPFALTFDGHVGAPDWAALKGIVHELGGFYQAVLATNLRRLGIAVEVDPRTGAAHLPVVPADVRTAFSRRTMQGEAAARAYAKAQGIDWDELDADRRIGLLKRGVQGDPRAAKVDDLGDFEAWHREAAALGWTPPRFVDPATSVPLPSRSERLAIAHEAAKAFFARAFEGEAVVDGSAARIAATRGLVASGVGSPAEIGDVARALIAGDIMDGGAPTTVIERAVRGRRGEPATRLTTAAHLAREQRLVELARAAAADRSCALTVEEIEAGAAAAALDLSGTHGQAQAAAMRAVGTGGRVGLLVGAAGAGKTTLMAGLCRAWSARERRIYGTAVAWRQAAALADAGIEEDHCIAVAALLARVRGGTLTLGRNDVVVLDEASLLSARDAVVLLELREATGFQLIVIGDSLQGRSVEAGGVVGLIRRALGEETAEVSSTVRQRALREREITNFARAGRVGEAVDFLREEGRARLAAGTRAEAAEAVATLWQERAVAAGEAGVLVMAPTQADAREVGAAIRRRRQAAGRAGPDLVTLDAVDQAGTTYDLTVGIGDLVRLFGRTYGLGAGRGLLGVNGSIVEVRAVSADGIALRAASGREALVRWQDLRDPETQRIRLGQGYVHSLASAQGATASEAILALPSGSASMDAPQFYVGASRHRDLSWIVLGEAAERGAVASRRPLNDSRPIRAADLWAHAILSFARRPESEGALALLERTRTVRLETGHRFRTACARMELRRAETGSATLIPSRRGRRHLMGALEGLARFVRERGAILTALVALIKRVDPNQRLHPSPGRSTPAPAPIVGSRL